MIDWSSCPAVEPLRHSLTQHEIATTFERGWSKLKNGELLDAAEKEGFAVLVTTDSNLKYQQNLQVRQIAVVVLQRQAGREFNAPYPMLPTIGDTEMPVLRSG
jgi:hypothetical protein